jgi:hypothetical protein
LHIFWKAPAYSIKIHFIGKHLHLRAELLSIQNMENVLHHRHENISKICI